MRALSKWMVVGVGLLANVGCGSDMSSYADYGGQVAPPSTEGEVYAEWTENDFLVADTEPTSTFSIDVDNASYTVMRRDIESGVLPQPESVRPEEYINYFDFDYIEPSGDDLFSINLEAAPSYFAAAKAEEDTVERHLLRVGLRGADVALEDMKATNLVFLVDTSGSMEGEKLELVEYALRVLQDHLRPTDTVGIVTYAGKERVLLEPTAASETRKIRRAINRLSGLGGGSTNAEAGIVKAFDMLESVRDLEGNNRVVILTDGDFNVGKSGDELIEYVESYRDKHLTLTAVGVGLGNYNDYNMEGLAQRANGNYFYLDSEEEADRIFGRDLPSTVEVIASDVKIQVEFNPAVVNRYRLIGYENRLLENEDFEDDTKDAGEVGAGHRVTAFYELELADDAPATELLAEVRLRSKAQFGEASREVVQSVKVSSVASTFDAASDDFRFGAAVAEFAEILRDSKHSEGERYQDVARIADQARDDADAAEFVELVNKADQM